MSLRNVEYLEGDIRREVKLYRGQPVYYLYCITKTVFSHVAPRLISKLFESVAANQDSEPLTQHSFVYSVDDESPELCIVASFEGLVCVPNLVNTAQQGLFAVDGLALDPQPETLGELVLRLLREGLTML